MTKKSIGLGIVVLGILYFAYPYVSLYRLGAALESGDPVAIEPKIEWQSVRQGLKDDMNGLMTSEMANVAAEQNNAFAVLGAMLATKMVEGFVDSFVTPRGIVTAFRGIPKKNDETRVPDEKDEGFKMPKVEWAFFEDPTTFRVDLRGREADPDDTGISIRMGLVGGSWKMTRLILPIDEIRKLKSANAQ